MAKKLVCLLSKEKIPNVEFIKEFGGDDVKEYIFISTKETESEGQLSWIIEACNISDTKISNIIVDPFNFIDIENSLKEIIINEEDTFDVNVTGGTKLLSILVYLYFKEKRAKIYYLVGKDKKYLKLFPLVVESEFYLKKSILLDCYLISNGFSIKNKRSILYNEQYTKSFLGLYNNIDKEKNKKIFKALQGKRENKKPIKINSIEGLKELLEYFKYAPEKEGELNKYEIQYLSGDWLEEYTYSKIKNELSLTDEEIGIGYKLNKNNVNNEFDVLFVYNNKLYTVECKTSIKYYISDEEGNLKDKNILKETIYKSDSLKNKFGLFTSTSILTLEDLRDEKGDYIHKYTDHINRAQENKINIIDKADVLSGKNISILLKITSNVVESK